MITLPQGFDVSVFLNELFIFASLAIVPLGIFYAGIVFLRILKKTK